VDPCFGDALVLRRVMPFGVENGTPTFQRANVSP